MTNRKPQSGSTTRIAGAACAVALLGSPALATNGYFANGYDAVTKGMAGAGVAIESGVMGMAQNPAMGMKVGREAGFCLSAFSPRRSFTVSGAGLLNNGTYESKNELFPIPCGGVNYVLDGRSSIGVVAYGNGGMNTEYDANVFPLSSTPLGINMEQLFIQANYSYQFNEQLTFGIGPTFVAQRFSATGLDLFNLLSSNPGSVTNNGDDWSTGGGVNLGLLWEPNEQWNIGLAYRSQMFMSPFSKYSGLFAEQGDFDIPAMVTLGAAYTPPAQPDLTLTAEYQHIFYGDIPSIANTNATFASLLAGLGNDDGAGFGWKDMDVVRVGANYQANDKWTFRGGVSYATEFTDSGEVLFNVIAPATPRWHLSVGATYQINDRWDISGAYTHVFDATVSGANAALAPGQPIELQMVQDEITVGMNFRW